MTPAIPVNGRRIRQLIAVPVLVAVAAFGTSTLIYPATATAERVWDIETFDNCNAEALAQYQRGEITFQKFHDLVRGCCEASDGDWNAAEEKCQSPPADTQGSRQLPGNVQIPSGIATAPAVTQAPPRPIQVPSDIATAPAVTQAPECPPETTCVP